MDNSSEGGERNIMDAAGWPRYHGRQIERWHDNYYKRQDDQNQPDDLHPAIHRRILSRFYACSDNSKPTQKSIVKSTNGGQSVLIEYSHPTEFPGARPW